MGKNDLSERDICTRFTTPVEMELSRADFPPPEALWQRYRLWKGLDGATETVNDQPFHSDGSGKEPHYYQRIAINRTVEAIAKGQDRILLVMATGRQDLHRLPDHLVSVEVPREATYPLPRRPQHPHRPDDGQRFQALRRRDDQDPQPQGRQVVRDLPRPLSGGFGNRGFKNIYRDYSRAEFTAATGISDADWTWAIRQLKEQGRMVQQGEKRGARYRLAANQSNKDDHHGHRR